MTAAAGPAAGKTNPHLFYAEGEADGAPGLSATRCRSCEGFALGRVPLCPHCFSREVEPVCAGQSGELVEFSIAHHPAGGFEAPYAIGLVRTREGLTLFAPIHGDAGKLRVGVQVTFLTLPREGGALGFAYTPNGA